MTSAPAFVECYSVRMLSPFQGMLQVITLPDARAVTRDGVVWRLLLRQTLSAPGWGSLDAGRRERRELTYGAWSQRAGLRRFPLDPAVDVEAAHQLARELLDALSARADEVPHPAGDPVELWLLDAVRREPLALLQSMRSASSLAFPPKPKWVPTLRGADFSFPGVPEAASRRSHSDILAGLIRREAGTPPRMQWFRRRSDGSGLGLAASDPQGAEEGRELAAEVFPELLLRETWDDGDTHTLVRAYLDWQAPRLLMLGTLRTETRLRSERQACRRPLEVQPFYRLYPRILDRDRINVALIEARLRQSVEA